MTPNEYGDWSDRNAPRRHALMPRNIFGGGGDGQMSPPPNLYFAQQPQLNRRKFVAPNGENIWN